MQFLYPGFLLALLAISVPILVHLFNFRKYKKVYFTNIRFLRDVQEETNSRSRLKHLLILLSRILFISFLVLAFAQPFIPLSEKKLNSEETIKSIFIDNSFSMNQVNTYGQLFNVAKQYAYQIVKSQPASSKFQIITQETAGRDKRILSQDNALARISELELSSESHSLSEIVETQKQFLDGRSGELFLLSDFQNQNDQLNFLEDTQTIFHLIPLDKNTNGNISVDSCWFEDPIRKIKAPEELRIKIRNHSDKSYKALPLQLHINGVQKAIKNVDLGPEESIVVSMSYSIDQPGHISGKITLDDFPIVFDNSLFFAYTIPAERKILVLNQNEDSVSRFSNIYDQKDGFTLLQSSVQKIGLSEIKNQDVIILNGLSSLSSGLQSDLSKWVNAGGKLVVLPPAQSKMDVLNQFLSSLGTDVYGSRDTHSTQVNTIEFNHPLLRDLFENSDKATGLPKVRVHFPLTPQTQPGVPVIYFNNGRALLKEFRINNGQVYLFAVSSNEEQSEFPRNALFFLSLYQIGVQHQYSQDLYAVMGQSSFFEVSNREFDDELMEIEGQGKRFIPEKRNKAGRTEFWFYDQLSEAGHYSLFSKEIKQAIFALNYNSKESTQEYFSDETLRPLAEDADHVFLHKKSFDSIGNSIKELQVGKQLWQLMIILALSMIVFEILLVKFWRE